ncbi:MAG TPA: HEAT repeat domain-containing protein [Pyrinomonadaceae bacterium]|nr:HEAT repeat domain-containing protein [Pyrinomonadaceae bacterium]
MRQNKQPLSLSSNPRRRLLLAFVACLCFAAFNFERARAQQPANTNTQKSRAKRITPLRTSDTPDGSRVTITSDGELNDYSAYRSGDRFIVVVPQAEGAGTGGARGRGFEGAQVEKRGKDLVYTFKLQPGATARVNQRFNRLDVQFSAPKGASASAAAKPTPAATPARRTPAEEAGLMKPPANANTQPTPDARRAANANANAALASATPLAAASPDAGLFPPVGAQPGATATPTLAPTPAMTPGADQIAQAQPSIAPPVSITTGASSNTAPTSVGAVVTRNWPWLLIALLAVGIGLFFISRFKGDDRDRSRSLPPAAPAATTNPLTVKETNTSGLKPSSAATTTTPAATNAATTGALGGATAAATGAAASGLTATSGKQSKKKKKKAEKAKHLSGAGETKAGGATAAAADAAKATGAATGDARTKDSGAAGGAIIAAGAALVGASALGGAAKTDEIKASETKAVEVQAKETKAIEPSVAFDPELIEAEIKKVLAGESYDERIINASDNGTRQLISAELMSAIAGRNALRQGHARTAFLRHGYFEEATRALQSAEAPGERAAAARTLGILGDRSATPHLTAALEDPSADVRRTSVEALAELRDPSAVDALEALRWRESSRQVPRTLIQRAIEASKVEEAEPVASVVEDETPTLAATGGAAVAPAAALAETEIQEAVTTEIEAKETATGEPETKELEVVANTVPSVPEATPFLSESPVGVAAEADATAVDLTGDLTVESPIPAAMETAAPETSIDETATSAPVATVEETKAIEVSGMQSFASNAAQAEFVALAEEPTIEIEADTVEAPAARVETDLVATLAAKEASLIEARRQENELSESAQTTKAIEPVAATPRDESPITSFDMIGESDTTTQPAQETQAAYRSDFAAGSGHAAVGDADWIDLDADEQEVTVQTIEPANWTPAEPPGSFYAENAVELTTPRTTDAPVSETPRDETSSMFDSLEIEPYEPKAAEPVPVFTMPVVESVRDEDRDTQQLNRESRPSTVAPGDAASRDTGIVQADKGIAIADGSDEDTYSIIPKGIQLRLASDDASERAASVLALSRLNTNEAFDQICEAFEDPAEEVRNAAARAIYELNEDRADSFTRALRESSVERRRQIGAALAGSGLAEEAIGNLTGEGRDKTYDAFSLLFLMAKAGEVAPLIRAIESHADNEVRLAVVKLLALSGQHEILPSFRRLAVRGSLPAEVRSAVMEAIYQISSQPQNATPAT